MEASCRVCSSLGFRFSLRRPNGPTDHDDDRPDAVVAISKEGNKTAVRRRSTIHSVLLLPEARVQSISTVPTSNPESLHAVIGERSSKSPKTADFIRHLEANNGRRPSAFRVASTPAHAVHHSRGAAISALSFAAGGRSPPRRFAHLKRSDI